MWLLPTSEVPGASQAIDNYILLRNPSLSFSLRTHLDIHFDVVEYIGSIFFNESSCLNAVQGLELPGKMPLRQVRS